MKVTMIGVLPPERSICHYCEQLSFELSKLVDLEMISYIKISFDKKIKNAEILRKKEINKFKNASINFNLIAANPLTWIKIALNAKGNIIHVQHFAWYTGVVYSIILPIVKFRQKKTIISVHNITPHVKTRYIVYFDWLINKFIFSFSDFYIVHNKRNKEKFMQIYDIPEEKISIIPHGILELTDSKKISKLDARKILVLKKDKKIILFFGYLWRYKGLDIILKALVKIKDEINNVQLVIVGQPFPHWKEYKKIIDKNNLSNHILIKLEYISDHELNNFISAADLCVFPYKEPFDTHGGAAALAIFYDKAIVITDIGGLPHYVLNKKAISKPEDTDGLAKNIINILKDPKLLKELEKDSKKVSKKLSWKYIAKDTVDIYKKSLM